MTTQHEAKVTQADRDCTHEMRKALIRPHRTETGFVIADMDAVATVAARHRAQAMIEGAEAMQSAYEKVSDRLHYFDPQAIIAEHMKEIGEVRGLLGLASTGLVVSLDFERHQSFGWSDYIETVVYGYGPRRAKKAPKSPTVQKRRKDNKAARQARKAQRP